MEGTKEKRRGEDEDWGREKATKQSGDKRREGRGERALDRVQSMAMRLPAATCA